MLCHNMLCLYTLLIHIIFCDARVPCAPRINSISSTTHNVAQDDDIPAKITADALNMLPPNLHIPHRYLRWPLPPLVLTLWLYFWLYRFSRLDLAWGWVTSCCLAGIFREPGQAVFKTYRLQERALE